MGIYDFTVKNGAGQDIGLSAYKGCVMLIVNTACACGYTPQFKAMEEAYQKYKDKKFIVLAFPCNQFGAQDPGTNEEIQAFASGKYNVTFPVMAKIEVNGKNADPLYTFLKEKTGSGDIKWNFNKFLVDKTGEKITYYESGVKPEDLHAQIESLLN